MEEQRIKKYKGMSLVEMLVAISIFSMAIAGFTLLFARSWKINSYTIEMGQSSFAASQGVNTLVSYLRKARQGDNGAYAIQSADDNELVVFSDYNKNGSTERLRFYLEDSQLKMGIANPTGGIPKTYPINDEEVRILAERIVNLENEPIFYYYNKDYPGDIINNPVATPADVSEIKLVKIFLKINIDPNKAPDNIEMQSFVELRNLNDYDRIK